MAYKGSLFQVLDEEGGIKGEVVFDSVISEGHEVSNKVTEFPIDSGFVVSDHVIRKNRVLTMEIMSVRHAYEGRQRGGGLTSGKHDKIKEDFDLLTEMVQKGLRCNVVTILGAYLGCVVVSFKTKQDVNTSTVMRANIVLKEMNVVSSDTSTSRQALIDTGSTEEKEKLVGYANSIEGPDPDAALNDLMGENYGSI
jgi:hypothetical protein